MYMIVWFYDYLLKHVLIVQNVIKNNILYHECDHLTYG